MKLQWWVLLFVKLSEKNLPELLMGEQLHKMPGSEHVS